MWHHNIEDCIVNNDISSGFTITCGVLGLRVSCKQHGEGINGDKVQVNLELERVLQVSTMSLKLARQCVLVLWLDLSQGFSKFNET